MNGGRLLIEEGVGRFPFDVIVLGNSGTRETRLYPPTHHEAVHRPDQGAARVTTFEARIETAWRIELLRNERVYVTAPAGHRTGARPVIQPVT
jgi:hypothetical protein